MLFGSSFSAAVYRHFKLNQDEALVNDHGYFFKGRESEDDALQREHVRYSAEFGICKY